MIGPRPCAYVDPVFTSQAKRKTNLSVFLVLMWLQFSLTYTCACAYAYAYTPVKTMPLTSYRKVLVCIFASLTYASYHLMKLTK